VLTPRKFLPGFTATLDYYDVKINGTIGSLGSNDIQRTCANTGALCNLIHRDSFYTTWLQTNGYVVTANANIGKLRSEGIDVTGSYTRPIPHDLGAFSVNLIGTYLLKESVNTGLYDYDCVGYFGNTCGNPTPTWRQQCRQGSRWYSCSMWRVGPMTPRFWRACRRFSRLSAPTNSACTIIRLRMRTAIFRFFCR